MLSFCQILAYMVIDQRSSTYMIYFSMYNMMFLFFFPLIIPDTESAKASRRQLKETIHAALFDMNVPAVCAINQVGFLLKYFFS